MLFKPFNRYLLIKEPTPTGRESTVLLPDDFKEKREYSVIEALSPAEDCKPCIRKAFIPGAPLPHFLVRTEMIETMEVHGHEVHMILENHVLGVITNE